MVQEISGFLSDQELDFIEKNFFPSIRCYKRGEILPIRKSDTERVCFLLGGTAYLTAEDAGGEKQILNYFIKGQIIHGSMIIRPGSGHSYVTAKYPCRIAFLSLDEIKEFRQSHPAGALSRLPEFIFQSCITGLQQHCYILQQKTIRNKILAFLHFQASQQKSSAISLPIPYSDLADYLSVDRSSLMKEISRMCREGLIVKKSRLIELTVTTPYF